jgi:hypothetical protein
VTQTKWPPANPERFIALPPEKDEALSY